jgi:hypothetical protein
MRLESVLKSRPKIAAGLGIAHWRESLAKQLLDTVLIV